MTLPPCNTLDLAEAGGVLRVTLDRPERRNAISAEMAEELLAVAEHAASRRGDLRAVVLRGAGDVFCAGGDLKTFATVFQGGGDRAEIVAANRAAGQFLEALADLPQVTIAAVEGAAMGGGVGLAAVADLCVVTQDVSISTTETSLGIVPAQIIPFLVRRLGATVTRRLTLTGARLDGTQAAAIGLADQIVADGDALSEAVDALLARIERCAPGANGATKDLIAAAATTPLGEYLDHAAGVFADTLLGHEAREGISAFVEKRRPAWRGEA